MVWTGARRLPEELRMKILNRAHLPTRLMNEIHDAIQAVEERPLRRFVTIAVWDDEQERESLLTDAAPLETRGYLLDAIYASRAMTEEQGAEAAAFDEAEDVRRFERGRMDVVTVGGSTIGRGVFEPGWRWSESVGPTIGAHLCPLSHVGYVVEGRMGFSMEDGQEFEVGPGDALHVSPGHDAWTIGSEPCVILEIRSASHYGRAVEKLS